MADMSYVEKAIGAAGMTKGAAVAILGTNRVTFDQKLREPTRFTFGDLNALGREMDDDSRELLWKQVDDIEATASDKRSLSDVRLGEYYGLRNSMKRMEHELAAMRASA